MARPGTVADMSSRRSGIIVAIVITALAAGLLLTALPSTRDRADEQRCAYRLRRLGMAVNLWVKDNGWRSFPPIVNPVQGEAWRPDRSGSADAVLWHYLHGDIPRPPRPGESAEQHRARLADEALTVCPITRLPFWYHEDLRHIEPTEVLDGRRASVLYFHSQRGTDGTWPTQDGDRPATWAVSGSGVQRRITAAEVEALRVQTQQSPRPNDPAPSDRRRQLERWERALAEHGGESFPIGELDARVHKESR